MHNMSLLACQYQNLGELTKLFQKRMSTDLTAFILISSVMKPFLQTLVLVNKYSNDGLHELSQMSI